MAGTSKIIDSRKENSSQILPYGGTGYLTFRTLGPFLSLHINKFKQTSPEGPFHHQYPYYWWIERSAHDDNGVKSGTMSGRAGTENFQFK